MSLSEPTRTFTINTCLRATVYLSSVMCGNSPKLQYFNIYFKNFPGGHAPRPPSSTMLHMLGVHLHPREVSPPFQKSCMGPPMLLQVCYLFNDLVICVLLLDIPMQGRIFGSGWGGGGQGSNLWDGDVLPACEACWN